MSGNQGKFTPSNNAFAWGEGGDVRRPQHDEIMLWADNELRTGKWANFFPAPTEESERVLYFRNWQPRPDWPSREVYETTWAATPTPAWPGEEPLGIEWEARISRGDRIIGFADLRVSHVVTRLHVKFEAKQVKVTKQGIGYTFPAYDYDWSTFHCIKEIRQQTNELWIEIKTGHATLGETIRQIKMYRSALIGGSRWLVVAPDQPSWREVLNREGIAFIAYPGA